MIDDIIKIMKKIFNMGDEVQLLPTDTQADISEWDSLAQMEIVTELEEYFDIKFDFMDLISMDSPAEIEKIVRAKKNGAGEA